VDACSPNGDNDQEKLNVFRYNAALFCDANGHGNNATPDNEIRHARFPLFNFPPYAGERANERLHEFYVYAGLTQLEHEELW